MDERVERENAVVLATVQALIGVITPSMVAVAVELGPRGDAVVVHVALEAPPDEAVLELLGEVADDVNGYLDDAAAVTVRTWAGADWTTGWPGREHRLVYAAHRP